MGSLYTFFRLLAIIALIPSIFATFQIGVGRADCTGPIVEIGFMGYAQLKQKGQGIHLRQFARAFIIGQNGKRVVFVSVDAGMIGHALKRNVIGKLQKIYGNTYNINNVIISGTHTHSTPGGFLMDLLYDISILGFVSQTFDALVNGVTRSIHRAHKSLKNGRIYIGETQILNANINRSPTSYLENPPEERAQYEYDVDKILTQIRFVDMNKEIIGAINWFAVHPTSMNNTNQLVSTDNVGYASILLEMEFNSEKLPGKGKFVGAFASSNLGDVSPNIEGPRCQKSGETCDILTSRCRLNTGPCISQGPGQDMFDSTHIIATRLFNGAMNILSTDSGREITGEISFIHQFVDMPKYQTSIINPETRNIEDIKGCVPAMGYSFAAGTTDGPGSFHFEQGTTTDNKMWNTVRDFISQPTKEDIECHSPKPILLATGRANFPYEWQPNIVATQLIQIGDIIIAAVPGEFTTMSGRRLRSRIYHAAAQAKKFNVQVIIAGLSNIYTSYITTPEEYKAQRYEAASTIFGPNTLTIYLEQYARLTKAMLQNITIEPGPLPKNLDKKVFTLTTKVFYDGHPISRNYGSVKKQPEKEYKRGEVVDVTFIAGNPRNNLMHEATFLTVEQKIDNNLWIVCHNDASWDTKLTWERVSTILGYSDVHISWKIRKYTTPGTYRIRHFGNSKFIFGGIFPYEGTSNEFQVLE